MAKMHEQLAALFAELGIDVPSESPVAADLEHQDIYERLKERAEHIAGHLENMMAAGIDSVMTAQYNLLAAKRAGDKQEIAEAGLALEEVQSSWRETCGHLAHLGNHLADIDAGEPGHIQVGQQVVVNRNLTPVDLFGEKTKDRTLVAKGTPVVVTSLDGGMPTVIMPDGQIWAVSMNDIE